MYATRRIKDAFRENKAISDPEKIKALVKRAESSLEIMKRQVPYSLHKLKVVPVFLFCLYMYM